MAGRAQFCSRRCALAEGLPLAPQNGRSLADRFWEKVERSDGCWEWRGSRNVQGYGVMRSGGGSAQRTVTHKAHRVSYELANGPVPAGFFVCHTCDNRGCVRPDHLYAGSPADNTRDRDVRGRNGMAKVTADQVGELRRRRANGETLAVLAADYGLSLSQTSSIGTGHDWKRQDSN